MNKILEALHLDDPASLKRAIAAGLGGLALLVVNPLLMKNGIAPLSDDTILGVAGIIASFLLQSGAKSAAALLAEAKAKGEQAGAEVKTVEDAAKVLSGEAK